MQRDWGRKEPGCKAAGGGGERKSLLWALQGQGPCAIVKAHHTHPCAGLHQAWAHLS